MWKFPYSSDGILRTIEDLARSYVPEWRLDTHTPDIGSVITLIYAGQMEQAAREYSRIPEQCIEELIHMLGIAPHPPDFAKATLIMEVDSACTGGIRLAKGSRFYGSNGQSDLPVVFRTRHDLLAVYAVLSCVLGISETNKKIVSCLEDGECRPVPLFDFSGTNLYQEELVLADPLLNDGRLVLSRPFKDRDIFLEDARIKAWGREISPLFLYDGEQELSLDGAAVFGNEIFPYKECYVGQDEVFSKAGARIVCTFELEWGSFDSGWHSEKRQELKPIMKRPPKSDDEERPHIYPQEISLTYYNGIGFKQLHCREGAGMLTKVFRGRKKCRLSFQCPEDFKPMTIGGYESRCIRLQVKRADNCYLPGAVFYYPILKNVKFSYTYGKYGRKAGNVWVRQGNTLREMADWGSKGDAGALFREFPYKDENMLFGFDRVWGEGPVSFYLELENQARTWAAEISYEYSTADGFKPLHITDGTSGLLRSGTVRFVLPGDAGMLQIEGRNCFWLRMRGGGRNSLKNGASQQRNFILKSLKLNGVEAENLYVSDEREFQLEKAKPGLSVQLYGSQILEAAVWVNEISSLSDAERAALLLEQPENVQAEYDIRGRISDFYVKWKESLDLEKQEGDGRYYMLDRKTGLLKFGDGRHTKVPQETQKTAWKVTVISCDGRRGNVEKDTITEPALSYAFLNRVYNPVGAYGGSDGENDREVAKRGRDFLSTGHRIISETDFIKEAEGYSGQIAQAVLLKGEDMAYRLIVLLKEPEKGGFLQLREALKVHLEEKFPLAFPGHDVCIWEPLFVAVSVNVWIAAKEDAYAEEETLLQNINAYFTGRPKRIGDMPGQKELEQLLYQSAGETKVKYFQTILRYTDEAGRHETALEDVKSLPDAVFVNGSHRVAIWPGPRASVGWNCDALDAYS